MSMDRLGLTLDQILPAIPVESDPYDQALDDYRRSVRQRILAERVLEECRAREEYAWQLLREQEDALLPEWMARS